MRIKLGTKCKMCGTLVCVDFCPKATSVGPCTEATEAEPRVKVTFEAD